jgi:hypothetical protein
LRYGRNCFRVIDVAALLKDLLSLIDVAAGLLDGFVGCHREAIPRWIRINRAKGADQGPSRAPALLLVRLCQTFAHLRIIDTGLVSNCCSNSFTSR